MRFIEHDDNHTLLTKTMNYLLVVVNIKSSVMQRLQSVAKQMYHLQDLTV